MFSPKSVFANRPVCFANLEKSSSGLESGSIRVKYQTFPILAQEGP